MLIANIIEFVIYSFTLVVVIHNFCRYLYPMRINKALIVLFYVGIAVKVSGMISALILSYTVGGSAYDLYGPIWWMILFNYLGENIVGVVLMM